MNHTNKMIKLHPFHSNAISVAIASVAKCNIDCYNFCNTLTTIDLFIIYRNTWQNCPNAKQSQTRT